MTIQQPPSDDIPSTPQDDDESPSQQPTTEPEQRAPGSDQPPVGAPRDEPDSELD